MRIMDLSDLVRPDMEVEIVQKDLGKYKDELIQKASGNDPDRANRLAVITNAIMDRLQKTVKQLNYFRVIDDNYMFSLDFIAALRICADFAERGHVAYNELKVKMGQGQKADAPQYPQNEVH